jgi:hypothetical protein
MSPQVLHLLIVLWAVAFAATMGWAAALAGATDQDWYKEKGKS